jgi:hypothetical protein
MDQIRKQWSRGWQIEFMALQKPLSKIIDHLNESSPRGTLRLLSAAHLCILVFIYSHIMLRFHLHFCGDECLNFQSASAWGEAPNEVVSRNANNECLYSKKSEIFAQNNFSFYVSKCQPPDRSERAYMSGKSNSIWRGRLPCATLSFLRIHLRWVFTSRALTKLLDHFPFVRFHTCELLSEK